MLQLRRWGNPYGEVSLNSTAPVVGDELTATLTDIDGSLADHVWQWESPPFGCFRPFHKVSSRSSSALV